MFPNSTSSGDEDQQIIWNFELFSVVLTKVPQEQIIKAVGNCLRNGAEINALDTRGKTVLDIAHDKNYEKLVTLLSELGGKTALDLVNCSDTDSYIIQQYSDVSRTRSQQQIRKPIYMNTADYEEIVLLFSFAMAYGDIEDIVSKIYFESLVREITLSEAQLKLLKQVNEEGDTLLSIAAKHGKKHYIDFFIRCGININHCNKLKKSAIDLAWENKHYDIVLTLLTADSDFPNHFDLTVLNEGNAQEKLKEFVGSRNSLHKRIKENHLQDIKDYVDAITGPKLYLNSEGQSAMFTAIESKKFIIFAFLKYTGFMFKNKDEEECINELSQNEKDMLKTVMVSKFPQFDHGHILYLTSKSRSEKPVDKERIEKLYRALDAIPEISILLKVIQYIDYLDIVFNFDDENIKDMNPTPLKTTKGTTDYKDGRIYIAAKIEENKLLGTVAHELTHLAMYSLYKNDCNPFDKLENNGRQTFESITADIKDYTKDTVKKIDNNIEDSPLITLARAFKYPEDEQKSELIVRIPHILAQYNDEGRRWLLNTNKEIKLLFDYFIDQAKGGIAYQCKKIIEENFLIKPRSSVQVLNEYLGEINNIIKYGINFENPISLNDFLKSNKQVFLLKTENTLLSILSIYESLIMKNGNYSIRDSLFLKFSSYIEKRGEINKLFYSDMAKLLCIRYPYDSDKERLSDVLTILNTLLEQKSDKKIIFIISESKIEEFNEIKGVFNNKCYKDVTDRKFTLNDLTKESQQKLLKREVIFQGEKISLNKLIDKLDKNAKQIIDAEMLEVLINNKVIKIGNNPLDTIDLEGAYSEIADEVNMETFVDKLLSEESNDIYIISGIPGAAKENSLIEYLVNADIDDTRKSKINDLESRILPDTTGAINNKIQVTDNQFQKDDFKQICRNNRERKIFWINLKHEDNVSKFMLEQIYNPDFYIKSDRFNNEVVIEKNVKEQLTSSALSEIFIISGKTKEEVTRWLQFRNDEERMGFKENCWNHRIMLLNSQINMLITFRKQVLQYLDQTIHLLKFEHDQLIWCKTYGSLVNLSKYRSKDHRNTKRLIGDDALIAEIKDDKVVIIAGDSGTGKTTTLVKLCELQYALQSGAKESIIKSHWLITINLVDHLDAIRAIDFNKPTEMEKQITDFLSKVDETVSDDFARGLLSVALVKQNFGMPLLITFDAFDEVLDKTDRDKVISLLECLKNKTKAKFWITTCLCHQQLLESTLSKFVIKLYSIDDETTSKSIRKYLKNHLNLILSHEEFQSIFGNSDEVTTRMQVYIKAFISKMHGIFKSDVSNLIGTPLQLYLMLEGSTRYFKEWMRDVSGQRPDFSYLGNDIWEVYENFSHRRYNIYFEKANIKEQQTQENNKIIFDFYHRALIKSFILHKSVPKLYLEHFRDIVLSAGIIRSNGSNIEFIHTTFGDYFAAKVVLNWITKWKPGNQYKFRNSEKQEYFLKEISVKTDYQVIRTFVNSKLLKEKMPKIHLLEEFDLQKVLFLAAKEGNVGIARFVLYNSSSSVNARDNDGRTVLHIAAASGNYAMVEFLVNEKKADFAARDNNDNTVLHTAVESQNLDIVKYLTGKGSNVLAINQFGVSVLHSAAMSDNFEIIKFLINEKGADFNSKDNEGILLSQTVAMFGNVDTIKFLIDEKGVDFEARNNDGCTAVHIAANSGNLEVVKYLINEKRADINAKNLDGSSILHLAATSCDLNTIKFLIYGREINFEAKNNFGKTVLHMAVESGNSDTVKFFINEKGADFKAKDNDGKTVLHTAVSKGFLDTVKFLINEKGADFRVKDNNGKTVLHMAVSKGFLDTVKFLINEKGADFEAKDNDGKTVLHTAVSKGFLDTVKFLINEKGADFEAKDNDGKTVLHTAVSKGFLDTVKFLINEKGADFEAKGNDGKTILHIAVSMNFLHTVKFLINEKGADFEAKDNDGKTVLHTAVSEGFLDTVKFLINEKGADFRS